MVGVILAAGDGVRLKNSTGEDCCKALRKINNMHLIEFALNNLVELEIREVFIVVGKQGDLIRNAIGHKYKGLQISYAFQKYQKGLINAFVQALAVIKNDENVVLQLADEIFIDFKAENIKAYIDEMNCDFYCGVTYENNLETIKNNFSVETDENLFIKKCVEKPIVVTNNLKGTGFCLFRNNVLEILKNIYDENTNTPNDLCDYINYLVSENKKGLTFCVAEKEFNINTSSNLVEAAAFLQSDKLIV